MKPVHLKVKLTSLFYINLWCIKFIYLLNAEKGYTAFKVMQERLEKNPKLFIKIVRSGN